MDNEITPNENKGAFACVDSKQYLQAGLTKREYIATHILAGIRANTNYTPNQTMLARFAIQQTDELLKQLKE